MSDRSKKPEISFSDQLAFLVTSATAAKANTAGEGAAIAEIVERLMHSAAVAIAFSSCAGDNSQVSQFSEGAIHYFETALADHLKIARAMGLHRRMPGGSA